MAESPSPSADEHAQATAHAYASNGLEVLQAASDAAAAAVAVQEAAAAQNALDNANHAGAPTVDTQQHHPQGLGQPMSYPIIPDANGLQNILPGGPDPNGMAGVPLQPGAAASAQGPYPLVASGPGAIPMRDPTINPKLTRLRRACDMCSQRKVKCDEAGAPCRPCRDLSVECTFNRELKRRGPPNKHAEAARAAKRAKMLDTNGTGNENGIGGGAVGAAFPPSPHNAAQALVSIAEGAPRLEAEAIAPFTVVSLLLDDFFTYVYPLTPFPHEPTFRAAWMAREDRNDPEFLGLLASMIAALVASLPRAARSQIQLPPGISHASDLIDKCQDVVLAARGSGWRKKQPKTLDDAMTSYFLGLAATYTMEWDLAREYTSESLTLVRALGFGPQKQPDMLPTFGQENNGTDEPSFNHVKDQVGKRLFWCLVSGLRSKMQFGGHQSGVVIPPSTPTYPYPAMPENVDDEGLLTDQILFPADGAATATLLTGLRYAIDIYATMNGIFSVEISYSLGSLQWPDQRALLREALEAAKASIADLPAGLQLRPVDTTFGAYETGLQYLPPGLPDSFFPAQQNVRPFIKDDAANRRKLQHEMQKANIYITQLATRCHFVDLYQHLRDGYLANVASGAIEKPLDNAEEMEDERVDALVAQEREQLVVDTLTIVDALSQRNLEPNGAALLAKLRYVATSRLSDPPERKTPKAVASELALSQLIGVLLKVERSVSVAGLGEATPELEDDANKANWAELVEFQQKLHSGSLSVDP